MNEDKTLQAAGALVGIVAVVFLVIQFAANRPAPKPGSGPGWYSRINPFGSEPSARPAQAHARTATPDLAPPAPVMTKAVSRQFSSPTAASAVGGLAGAEPAAPATDAAKAPMNSSRLINSDASFPSGGRAPTAGGGVAMGPGAANGPGGPAVASSGGARPAPGAGAPGVSGGVAPGKAGAAGDTKSSAGGAAAFNAAAGAGVAGASSPGVPPPNSLGAVGGSGPKTESLNEPATLSGSSGGGGGGGPGGGGGGGSGGAGSGKGFGGGAPNAKPKESAGKPDGATAGAAGGSPAGGGSAAGASTGRDDSGPEPDAPSPKTGAPDVGEGVPTGHRYSLQPRGPEEIETFLYTTKKNVPILGFTAKMAIGAGPGGGSNAEAPSPRETALRANGTSLNAGRTPFIVIPDGFVRARAHQDVALGDFAAVNYGGKTYYAIVGDLGPQGVLGGASPALARAVGVDPAGGGVQSASVRYWILPKSARQPPPTRSAEIQRYGAAAFAAAGAELK